MELDKFLNEYEFDWAAMPALNKEFSYTDLKGKTVAIISKKDCFLAKALLYSFLCVNDIKKAQLKVVWALLEENTENNLKELKKEREDFEIASFYKLQQAHICIYADVAGREEAVIDKQKEAFMAGFVQVCDRVAQIKPEQFLIGSDYRIYGKTVKGICLSEKELIESDCATAAFFRTLEEKGQKLLKKTETNITIFRTAQLYGPCGITWGRIYEMLLSLSFVAIQTRRLG